MVTFYGLSAAYEPGDWFVMAELGRVDSHSVLGEATGWYVSSGHRFGRITPYAIYAQTRPNSSTRAPGLDVSALPPSQAAAAGALNAELNTSLATIASQRTVFAGCPPRRREQHRSKAAMGPHEPGNELTGLAHQLQPGFRPGSNLTLVSATLDFVF
jgi:hypothetical protein